MKKLSIFSIILAFVVLLTGCVKEDSLKSLKELEVSQTFLSIAPEGGSVAVTIDANTSWEITSTLPDWLGVSAKSGAANSSTTVNFSAESCAYGREAVIQISAGVHTQFITVRQGDMVAASVTCKEAMTGTAGKTYRIKGAVTKIVNTTYGNLYLTDGSISPADGLDENAAYVYGTLDAKGAEKNFLSLGIEVGDVITIEGPLSYYGTTPELVNVTVLEIEKSLLKLIDESVSADKTGGIVSAKVAYKGSGAYASILDGAESWISLQSTDFIAGVPSKLEKSPADTMVFNFAIAANAAGARSGQIEFSSSNSSGSSSAVFTINQGGSISEVSIAEFNAAEVGDAQYRVTAVVSRIANASYGNVYIRDWSGETYIYGIGAKGDFEKTGIKVGDIITVVGKRGAYGTTIEMLNTNVEKVISVNEVDLPTFIAAEKSKDVYYRLTGTITNIANTQYGNLYIKDDAGNEVYVYGLYPGYGATGDNRKNFLATAGIEVGDILTVEGYKDVYNGTIELCGGIYISHKKGGSTPDPQPSGYSIDVSYTLGASAYDDGAATVNGTEVAKTIKIGTSSKQGDFSVAIPSGCTKLSFYAVAWKGSTDAVVEIYDGETLVASKSVAGNDGATGNAPYTITVADTDKYSLDVPAGKTVKVTSNKRVIFFGIKAE